MVRVMWGMCDGVEEISEWVKRNGSEKWVEEMGERNG